MMNYIELINNMWSLREQGLLTVHDCDLYLFLVHRCNRLSWKNPFTQPTDITCAILGVNRNALVSRRNKLRQLGLIAFKEGERKTKPPVYTLLNPKGTQADTLQEKESFTQQPAQTVTDTRTNTINKTKLKKKEAYVIQKEVDYQFVISTFNELCKSLPMVKKLTPQRIQKVDIALAEVGIDKLFECFRLAEESYFLSKRDGKWRATFDWIIEPANIVKILEGCYNNGSKDGTPISPKHYENEAKQYGAEQWQQAAAQIARG